MKATCPVHGAQERHCERDGCTKWGRAYFITDGVVHADLDAGHVAISTNRSGHGWITLCAQHALADLGVALA